MAGAVVIPLHAYPYRNPLVVYPLTASVSNVIVTAVIAHPLRNPYPNLAGLVRRLYLAALVMLHSLPHNEDSIHHLCSHQWDNLQNLLHSIHKEARIWLESRESNPDQQNQNLRY